MISLNSIISILVCPDHTTEPLTLKEDFELTCVLCSKSFKVLDNSPVKIDFTNGFISGLLDASRIGGNPKHWTNWRQENLEFLMGRKIDKDKLGLDIGAGDSLFHSILKLDKLVSIDFTNYPSTNIICDLNFNIPLASSSINYILMTNVLEHLYDYRVLKEAHRLLTKNSYLYITVPFLLGVHNAPYDYHRYTHFYLIKILEELGFEIEYFSPSGDLGSFETLVEHYFRFPIHNGNLLAKILWQVQKVIIFFLKVAVPVNYRLEYTGGYMISAKKIT